MLYTFLLSTSWSIVNDPPDVSIAVAVLIASMFSVFSQLLNRSDWYVSFLIEVFVEFFPFFFHVVNLYVIVFGFQI